jgi:hypothetical protein
MRTEYRNGSTIDLIHCGCDGCSPSTINGVFCHEEDCPDAWRDYRLECRMCGGEFWPEHRYDQHCTECTAAF